jgi:hypothetical protein
MTEKIIIQKRPPKSPVAAGILSGIFPCAGQLYNGQYTKGILFIIIFAGLITMQPHSGQPFTALLLSGFYIFQIIEAVQAAKLINRQALAANGAEVSGAEAAAKIPGEEITKQAKSGSVFWGIVLIALGVIFLTANFDLIDYDRIFDFWPLVVIVIGVKMIADYFSRKNT